MDERLLLGAQKIVTECLNVQQGERVLIVSDHGIVSSVPSALREAARRQGASVTILTTEPMSRPGEEPGSLVRLAMLEADVIIAVTTRTLWHTDAATKACAQGARLITLTECTEQTLCSGAIEADFWAIQPTVRDLLQILDRGNRVHVTTKAGTDLYLDIGGRVPLACSGICDKPGMRMGFPDLEVYVAPIEESVEGTIVIDASSSGIGLVTTPIELTVVQGCVEAIAGGREADVLKEMLVAAGSQNAYIVCELAFGLNNKAEVVGRIIEDEGVYGTGHFALGNNIHFGGKNVAPIHIDMVYWRPTIVVDGKTIMREGELVYMTDRESTEKEGG